VPDGVAESGWGTPAHVVDRLGNFRAVGWYWNGELHLFEGETMPNGVANEYEGDADTVAHVSSRGDDALVANEQEHLMYWAWTIIANAGEGDWTRESDAWQKAAHDWRERWHLYLSTHARTVG